MFGWNAIQPRLNCCANKSPGKSDTGRSAHGFSWERKNNFIFSIVKNSQISDSAIIINEVGDIGLDHALVERGREDIVLLEGGCICCRLKGGLNDTLVALLRGAMARNYLSPCHRIEEASGLTDPFPVLGALIADPRFSRNFTLAGVTTVVDALDFSTSHSLFPKRECRLRSPIAF